MPCRGDKLLRQESKRTDVPSHRSPITPGDESGSGRHTGCADVAVLLSVCSQPRIHCRAYNQAKEPVCGQFESIERRAPRALGDPAPALPAVGRPV